MNKNNKILENKIDEYNKLSNSNYYIVLYSYEYFRKWKIWDKDNYSYFPTRPLKNREMAIFIDGMIYAAKNKAVC